MNDTCLQRLQRLQRLRHEVTDHDFTKIMAEYKSKQKVIVAQRPKPHFFPIEGILVDGQPLSPSAVDTLMDMVTTFHPPHEHARVPRRTALTVALMTAECTAAQVCKLEHTEWPVSRRVLIELQAVCKLLVVVQCTGRSQAPSFGSTTSGGPRMWIVVPYTHQILVFRP